MYFPKLTNSGLGAWATLPSVIGGYIGNPFTPQPWIESALAQGQSAGRWPNNALDLDVSGNVIKNKFTELPLVGKWPRRLIHATSQLFDFQYFASNHIVCNMYVFLHANVYIYIVTLYVTFPL